MPDTTRLPNQQTRPDRFWLVALLIVLVALGAFVEWRSGRVPHKRTDLGVYLRAAWAVRSGQDIYKITDNNGWHYHYPPLLAIAITPLADPPSDAKSSWTIPWAVSVGLWYAISITCLLAAVHLLANALSKSLDLRPQTLGPTSPRYYWLLRTIPLWVCLPVIGRNLVRGQVGTILLLLLAGMAASLIRRQHFRAGLWLAAAICLKIIPAFLLIYPLWRRDRRCLAGCAAGLFLGLIAIPAAILGPSQTIDAYHSLYADLLSPGLRALGDDVARAGELTNINATDSNSPLTVLHNLTHLNLPRDQRPTQAGPAVRAAHWIIAAFLTITTLLAAGRRKPQEESFGTSTALFISTLTLVHLIASPVCHPHYFTLSVLPALTLLAAAWERHPFPRLPRSLLAILWLNFLAHVLTIIPGLEILRDTGLVLLAALSLWLACVVELWRLSRTPTRPSTSSAAITAA